MPPLTNTKSPSPIDCLFGERIRARRLAMHKSRKYLSNSVSCSWQQIQKYEIGRNRVPLSRAVEIAKALDTTIDALLDGLPSEKIGVDYRLRGFMTALEQLDETDASRMIELFTQILISFEPRAIRSRKAANTALG